MSRYYQFIQRIRYSWQFVLLAMVFVAFLIGYSYFEGTVYYEQFEVWAHDNYWRLVIFLLALKIIGIIWPPLPGVVPLIAAIPVLGWFPAFLIDTAGYFIGASLAFLLARRYGMTVIRKLFGVAGEAQVKRFNVKPERELEAVTLMKIFGGGIGEFISYAAGITNMRFRNFFLGSVISSVVVGIPLFYFFGFALSQNNLLYALIPIVVGLLLFYFLRRRYFDWE